MPRAEHTGSGSASGGVLYVAKMFPRASETFILREVLALRRHGIPVRVVSLLPPDSSQPKHEQAEELRDLVDVLPSPEDVQAFWASRTLWRFAGMRGLSTFVRSSPLLRREGRRRRRRLIQSLLLAELAQKHEIAHFHAAWAHTPATVTRLASRWTGIPWTMGAHAKDIHLSRPSSLAKKLRSARWTVACTAAHQALLEKMAPEQETSRVRLLPHGVDLQFFAPTVRRPRDGSSPLHVVFVGRLVAKKGVDTMAEALGQLHQKGVDFCLEVIGDGPERTDLERRLSERGLASRSLFRGMLDSKGVLSALQRADCLVAPSRVTAEGDRDGIPNSLAEAMACGLAVVATAQPGIRELVEHRRSGLLIPQDDARALCAALVELDERPEFALALGQEARKKVQRTFDGLRCGEEFARAMSHALERRQILYVSADRGVPVHGTKGASVHLRSLAAALRKREHEVRVLTTCARPQDRPQLDGWIQEARTGVEAGKDRPLRREVLRLLDNRALVRAGRELGRQWRPDFVYERYALTSWAGGRLARRWGVPHILEVNAPLAREEQRFRELRLRRLTHRLERKIFRGADVLIVPSQRVADFVSSLGVPSERIRLLPNAADLDLFAPLPDARRHAPLGRREQLVTVFAGSLKPWQGVELLVRAFALVAAREPRARLRVLGHGPLRSTLEGLTGELGVHDKVRFLGGVAHREVAEHLREADLAVAPYADHRDFYFSPMKIAEYRAAGLGVLASSVGDLPRQLGPEQGVVFFSANHLDHLAEQWSRLLGSPGELQALGRAAQESCRWSWDDVARTTVTVADAARRQRWGWT